MPLDVTIIVGLAEVRTVIMWTAIGLISSGFALVAFVVAAVASVAKAELRKKNDLIERAPLEQRAALIQDALESFHIDTGRITSEEKLTQLLKQQMAMRERAQLRAQMFGLTTVVVLCALAAFAMTSSRVSPVSETHTAGLPGASTVPDGLPGSKAPAVRSPPEAVPEPMTRMATCDGTNIASCNTVDAGAGSTVTIEAVVNLDVGAKPTKKRDGQ